MSELKPCPFCGGKAVACSFFDVDDLDYMPIEVNDNDAEVTCENERCINGWYLSPKDWNTRPIEDALHARIAELEAEIYQLTAHSDIERQDDKSSNDTQTSTIVYGKEREE